MRAGDSVGGQRVDDLHTVGDSGPDRASAYPLRAAGLGQAEEAAYELVIEHPASAREDLEQHWESTCELGDALAGLEEKGLIGVLPGAVPLYTAVAPDVALDVLLGDSETALQQARAYARQLHKTYRSRIAGAESETVEVVAGRRAVAQRCQQVQRAAQHEVRRLRLAVDGDEAADEVVLEVLGRGVSCRTVYRTESSGQAGVLANWRRLSEAGEEARILPSLPISLYVCDDRYAVLPLEAADANASADTAIIVYASGLLDALTRLFEGLWRRALPVPFSAASVGLPGERMVDQQLVSLLLTGMTDEAIARQLGISHRTCQRRVAALMDGFGAHTRFQAGVQAALRSLPAQ